MPPPSSADDPKTRILFLAANPDLTTPLHAGREVRRIRDRLAGTRFQNALQIIERWAVRPSDLQQALIEVEPHIVTAAFRVSLSLIDPILQIMWSRLGVFPSRFRSHDAMRMSEMFFKADVDALVDHGMLDGDPDDALDERPPYRLPRSGRRLAISGLTEDDSEWAERLAAAASDGSQDNAPSGAPAITLDPSRLEAALRAARRSGYRSAEVMYTEVMADKLHGQAPAPALMEQALILCRELGDRSAEVRILGKLFLLHKRSNERRAVELGEQAMVLLRDRGELREESLMLKEVYPIHRRLKNERRAVELCERNVAISRELGMPWAEGLAVTALAELYEELGDDRRAVEVAKQCLAMAGSRSDVARRAYRISLIHRRLGEFDEAIAALEVCVEAVGAVGWTPEAASAALGRSANEGLEAELSRLRAERAT